MNAGCARRPKFDDENSTTKIQHERSGGFETDSLGTKIEDEIQSERIGSALIWRTIHNSISANQRAQVTERPHLTDVHPHDGHRAAPTRTRVNQKATLMHPTANRFAASC